jgi:hypothetical protein
MSVGVFGLSTGPLFDLASGTGAGLISRATSQLWLPIDQYLSAQAEVSGYLAQQEAWYRNPGLLPGPDALFDLRNKGYFAGTTMLDMALRHHGILSTAPTADDSPQVRQRKKLWEAVASLKMEYPGVDFWMDLWLRGFVTDEQVIRQKVERAGGHFDSFNEYIYTRYERPGVRDIMDGVFRGRITPEDAAPLMRQAGSHIDLWLPLREAKQASLSTVELTALMNRGVITQAEFRKRLDYLGFTNVAEKELYEELSKGLPGVADLTLMGIREAFRPELAVVYDYYKEFPERTREWYAKLGLDYPVGFDVPKDGGVQPATLADLYWASHWHPMPLGSAYLAYQRMRPERMDRYLPENPNLKPFTKADLQLHMRIADLPPGVRDWMVALSHPPLGRRDVQWGVQFAQKGPGWATEQYLDLGYVREDAELLARVAMAREEKRREAEEYRANAWIRGQQNRVKTRVVDTVEQAYSVGMIDYDFAHRQLHDAGVDEATTSVIVDMADFRVKIGVIKQAIAATSRDFLSGELSSADVEIQLGRLGITSGRVRDYLSVWGIRRDRRRKQLETAKIEALVAQGFLGPADARVRLGNLGWSDPDATLLLAEAQGRLSKRLASEEKARESAIQRRARELERLAKDADAQSRKLRAEANRVAPRSVLMRWVKEGEIGEDSFRSMMRERGYPEGDIDLYWQETQRPRPRPPRPAPTVRPFPRPEGSAHPGLAILRKWFNDGVIDSEKVRDGIKGLGYSDSDTDSFLRDWGAVPTNGSAG